MSDEPLLVPDARNHPFLKDNLAVPDIGVIAYAGVPIRDASGYVLGSLCAIDSKPRDWRDEDLNALIELASELTDAIQ